MLKETERELHARIEYPNGDVFQLLTSTCEDKDLWEKFSTLSWNVRCGVASIFDSHTEHATGWQQCQLRNIKNIFVADGGARGALVEMIKRLNDIYGKEPLFVTEY